MKKKFKLGERVRDTLSGYEGICYSINTWLHGCRHIGIKPLGCDKDGKPWETRWFDEPQVEHAKGPVVAPTGAVGGPKETPTHER